MTEKTIKQKFIVEQTEGCSQTFPKVEFKLPEESSLGEILEAFKYFLISVGFIVSADDRLEIVSPNKHEKTEIPPEAVPPWNALSTTTYSYVLPQDKLSTFGVTPETCGISVPKATDKKKKTVNKSSNGRRNKKTRGQI